MNRLTLTQLRSMSAAETSRVPVDQLALLLEDVAELKADAKALGDLLTDALHARYGDQAAILRRADGKDSGRVRISDADFEVLADLPKKVDWHQARLREAVETVRGWGEDPADYVSTEIRVPEPRYAAWPPKIRAVFEAARTVSTGRPSYRTHLGASLIGAECERSLWLTFRWASRARHTGRLLRLFETGNLAEGRFVAELRRIGITVIDINPETGRQWSLRDPGGHFGGSMDAVAIGFPEAPKAWHVCEFKTRSEKSFLALKADGVAKTKPLHWAQMQAYMHLAGISRAFYLAVNKNTDELYQERIAHDPEAGLRLLVKAARIIEAPRPPARISDDPAWWQCRFCDHHAVCHQGAAVERHCRSCLHASPAADGAWQCARHSDAIPRAQQERGCPDHLYIPDLVPGEQLDAGADWVSYRLRDGSEWRDGAPA